MKLCVLRNNEVLIFDLHFYLVLFSEKCNYLDLNCFHLITNDKKLKIAESRVLILEAFRLTLFKRIRQK